MSFACTNHIWRIRSGIDRQSQKSRESDNSTEISHGFTAPLSLIAPEDFRNQEKGVLAKGVSVEFSVAVKETKLPKDIGPSSTFGTQSATAKRGVHFAQNPLKKTFSWSLIDVAKRVVWGFLVVWASLGASNWQDFWVT